MEEKTWYTIKNVAQLDSPALVFYADRIAENIKRLKQSIKDISRLRPHVKTHKSAAVTSLMINAGITKFKCATIAEAEMLGICKAPDVLLAYQLTGPKIDRFIKLIRSYPETQFSCLFDNEISIAEYSAAAIAAGLELSVFADLNVGMNRTGILPGEACLALYKTASDTPGLIVKGFHAYDGHIHDASYDVRKEKWLPIWNILSQISKQVVTSGMPQPVIIAGGTPTFPFYAGEESVECSPGTFILWDKGYQDAFTEQSYLTGAVVITRVISLTQDNLVSLDLGHKSIAAENELRRRVFFLNAPDAVFVSQSEEHLVLDLGTKHGFSIGDVLYGLPIHICPTVALYNNASIAYNQEIKDEWEITSRTRKITI
ncbi:D-TA family PLP-dependent enzyme [Pedobacter antarcticus]|uniref:D-TA family PLP-dependent enzyme n=1 Tax=Pedobacter antarcticus TaxID=34086 RepID=UPI0029305E38|nr:D-TA family PLP-dependent enzyme [Pedobacter antarcticus]